MKLTVCQYLEEIVHLGRCYIHKVVSDIIRINIPQVDADLVPGYEVLTIG